MCLMLNVILVIKFHSSKLIIYHKNETFKTENRRVLSLIGFFFYKFVVKTNSTICSFIDQ